MKSRCFENFVFIIVVKKVDGVFGLNKCDKMKIVDGYYQFYKWKFKFFE